MVIDYKLDLIGKKQLENNIASHKAKKVFASGTKNKNVCGKQFLQNIMMFSLLRMS